MKPGTVAFEDQVAATLRDLDQATTGEIRRAMPEYEHVFMARCRCQCGELEHRAEWGRRVMGPDSSQIRTTLRRLAREGKVIEVKTPQPNNHGGHLWLWVSDGGEDQP